MKNFLFLILLLYPFLGNAGNIKHKIWSKDNTLIVEYRGEGDMVEFKMMEGLHMQLEKKADEFFEGALEIPGLDSAIFNYSIKVYKKGSDNHIIDIPYGPENGERYFHWIGKKRSEPHRGKIELEGILKDTTIFSEYLEEDRKLTIYLPKDYSKLKSTPIIYMTDGEVVKDYSKYVEKLIDDGRIGPVVLVGVHSSKKSIEINGKQESLRFLEYVDRYYNNWFIKHQKFFLNEVVLKLGRSLTLVANDEPQENYLYGFSNGGAFCVQSGITKPDMFKEIIAFSTVGYISGFVKPIEFNLSKYPKFYLATGKYESGIFEDNLHFYEKLKSKNIEVSLKKLVCGHDYYVWREEFLNYLIKRMPAARN